MGTTELPTRTATLRWLTAVCSGGRPVTSIPARFIVAGMLAIFALLATSPTASAQTRSLKLYFVHTGEKAEITYMRNGRYIQSGLDQVNRFLRDWRRNEPTKMDPHLLDLVWEVYQRSGSRDYIHVISAYRSPQTNAMLRKRSRGVAKKSQHMLGKAMDFYLPDVKLSKLRRIGLTMQNGGVGYYPKSGSPFVHMDTGSVRHWPRMSRQELVSVFPDGKTLHVPSDGKPLPGYQEALASYNKRMKANTGIVVASTAEPRRSSGGGGGGSTGGFLSAFFNGGADNEEDLAEETIRIPRASDRYEARRAKPTRERAVETPEPPEAIETPEPPKEEIETPSIVIASLPDKDVPVPRFAPRPSVALAEADDTAKTVAVAFDVPRPIPRPAIGVGPAILPAESVTGGISNAKALAMAQMADTGGLDEARMILSGAATADQRDEIAAIPLPAARPNERDPIVLAALPLAGPLVGSKPADLRSEGEAAKSSRLTREKQLTSDSLRSYVLASLDRSAGLDTLEFGARTTDKAPKPIATGGRRERHAVVVPMPTNITSRAFAKESIVRTAVTTRVPSFAFNLSNGAPAEVYTDGFSMTARVENPHRFTGKAVTFLSVARFD